MLKPITRTCISGSFYIHGRSKSLSRGFHTIQSESHSPREGFGRCRVRLALCKHTFPRFRTHLKLLKSKIRSLSGLPNSTARNFPSASIPCDTRTSSNAPPSVSQLNRVSTPPLRSNRVLLTGSLKPNTTTVNIREPSLEESAPTLPNPQAHPKSSESSRAVEYHPPKVVEGDAQPPQSDTLVKCDRCSRTFRDDIIDKHASICAKNKSINRPKFDSKTHRMAGIQAGGKAVLSPFVGATQNQNKPVSQDDKILIKRPSWRDKSDQLRAAIGAARSTDPRDRLRFEQELARVNQQCLTKCDFCGRSFNVEAAARHIPICRNKAQMMPRKIPTKPIEKTVAEVTSRVLSRSAAVVPLATANRSRPGLR